MFCCGELRGNQCCWYWSPIYLFTSKTGRICWCIRVDFPCIKDEYTSRGFGGKSENWWNTELQMVIMIDILRPVIPLTVDTICHSDFIKFHKATNCIWLKWFPPPAQVPYGTEIPALPLVGRHRRAKHGVPSDAHGNNEENTLFFCKLKELSIITWWVLEMANSYLR